MEFAPATDGITGTLVNCGLAETSAACGTHAPGFVALIQRGSFSFAQKVDSAMKAGAAAAIVYNNAAGLPNGTLGTIDDNHTPWIPAIGISQADGQALASSTITTATVHNIAMAWNFDSGTSMATPHVSGVAALIFGKNPKLSPSQVETILERTATDLGVPNYDTKFGWGLVNALAALTATPAP
jgi:serine protease